MLLKNVLREVSSLCIGIITSNGVKDIDAVLEQLLSSNFRGSFTFLAVAALDAVLFVGELNKKEG